MNRRPFSSVLMLVLVAATGRGWAQSTPIAGDLERIAVVDADDVYVRAGGGESYYPFGKLNTGDLVKVVQEKYGWARIRTVGPAFRDFFGYVEVDPGRFVVEADGRAGHAVFSVDLLAPNLNTKFKPEDSWRRILEVAPGRTLTILETVSTDRKVVHKVGLPAEAEGWISVTFLRDATPEEVEQWQQAMTKPLVANASRSTEPPTRKPEPMTEATVAGPPAVTEVLDAAPVRSDAARAMDDASDDRGATSPTADPPAIALTSEPEVMADEILDATTEASDDTMVASAAEAIADASEAFIDGPPVPWRSPRERLRDLEEAQQRLRQERIEDAEVIALRDLYLQLASDAAAESRPVSSYAAARAEQLTIWGDLQQQRREIVRLQQRLTLTTEEADDMRLALESQAQYVAIGRLQTSQIFNGDRLPRLYRVLDPTTGRTIAYIKADQAFDYAAMLNRLIGIVGEQRTDATLGVTLLAPRRIDLLTSKSEGLG